MKGIIAGVSGTVVKIGRYPISDTWFVSIQVTSTFVQTYAGFTRKPKIRVGDRVEAGDEII